VTRPRIELYVTLVLCASFAAFVCADESTNTLSYIRQNGTLRVATTGDYRPFSFTADDGSRTGIDIDLATILAAELGVKLQWVDTSWASLVADLANHRYDIAMSGISITPARVAVGRFSEPYFATGKTILASCALQGRLVTLDQIDRPDVTVIVNPGGTNEQFVHTQLPRAHIIVNPDNRSIFDALADGAADLMITDAVEAQLEAAAHPQLCVPTRTLFEQVDKAYLMPADPAWQAWIDAWLARVRASGRLDAITRRYLPAVSPP
jgi:cyclohexadienyl dehydratase